MADKIGRESPAAVALAQKTRDDFNRAAIGGTDKEKPEKPTPTLDREPPSSEKIAGAAQDKERHDRMVARMRQRSMQLDRSPGLER